MRDDELKKLCREAWKNDDYKYPESERSKKDVKVYFVFVMKTIGHFMIVHHKQI